MTVEERDDIETGNQDPDEEPSRQRKEQRKKKPGEGWSLASNSGIVYFPSAFS